MVTYSSLKSSNKLSLSIKEDVRRREVSVLIICDIISIKKRKSQFLSLQSKLVSSPKLSIQNVSQPDPKGRSAKIKISL